ncbi:MAG: lipopolysaccharide heptosyltransferase II [Nitrospira sp.]|nr:lipopolysaccharide heptosyltransferase II [Nitrospira sp.]
MRTIKLITLPKKILIIKPSSLGDVVHSLPFLNAIRTCFPKAEIHWVIAKGLEGLLEGHPMINKLWIINKDTWKKMKHVNITINEIRMLFKALKKEKFDLVVDLQGLLRSGILTAATGAPVKVGFKEAREGSRFFYTYKVEGERDIHAVDRYLKIARFLGCDISDVCFPFPLYKPTSSFIFHPSSFHFSLSKDYAVIIPGARWKTKIWPYEHFGELLSMLPLDTVIVGSKGDKDIADKIVTFSKGKAISLAGKTDLKDLIEVIRDARFVVSNDSGPMHIAAALHIPVFAIFGPTDPLRTGPYGEGHTIIKEKISCAPCFKRTCSDIKCMRAVSVEKVYETIMDKLNLATEDTEF